MNASSAPNFRFFGAPPKESKPIAAAISGSISMSMFDVNADECVVQLSWKMGGMTGNHGKSASQPRANPDWAAAKTLARQEVMVPLLLEALNIQYV